MTRGDAWGLAAVAAASVVGIALVFSGCGDGGPQAPARDFATPQEAELHAMLEEEFGTLREPRMPANLPIGGERLGLGRASWGPQCAHCHGMDGSSNTFTARALEPRPRDLRSGVLKYKSTERDWPPTRADVLDAVTDGVPYTAMSGFANLPEEGREALTDYTLYLMLRGRAWARAREALEEGAPPNLALERALEEVRARWNAASEHVVEVPPAPPATPDAIARGDRLFHGEKAACASCHGDGGAGDGPLTRVGGGLQDDWGRSLRVRDLRTGRWRGGSDPEDLYRRVSQGIPGTPMPAMADLLSDDEIWSLVHYVQSLAD